MQAGLAGMCSYGMLFSARELQTESQLAGPSAVALAGSTARGLGVVSWSTRAALVSAEDLATVPMAERGVSRGQSGSAPWAVQGSFEAMRAGQGLSSAWIRPEIGQEYKAHMNAAAPGPGRAGQQPRLVLQPWWGVPQRLCSC